MLPTASFPQSNGEVESMVRTIKDLLHKAHDSFLTLPVYKDTNDINSVSPAQLLIGRRLQTTVSNTPVTRAPSIRDQDDRD